MSLLVPLFGFIVVQTGRCGIIIHGRHSLQHVPIDNKDWCLEYNRDKIAIIHNTRSLALCVKHQNRFEAAFEVVDEREVWNQANAANEEEQLAQALR